MCSRCAMFTIALQCWGLCWIPGGWRMHACSGRGWLQTGGLHTSGWWDRDTLVKKLTMGLVSFDTDTNRFTRRNELDQR